MPSLKDLRNRIAATKATQKITKAMQMVAASKLRRAQAAAEAARPYASRMDTVLGNIAASVIFAGAQGAYSGLDQVNVTLPSSGVTGPTLPLSVTVGGNGGTGTTSNIGTIAISAM